MTVFKKKNLLPLPMEPAWKDAIVSLRPLVRHSCLLLLAFKRDVGSDTS